MIAERWQQIREIFDHALVLSADERLQFLDTACASDPELRREVDSLLFSHEEAGTRFLRTPAVDLSAPGRSGAPTRVGRRIGPYDILEEIAHGGMGEVYRAERADGQYEQEVAIKLVRCGRDAAGLLERFRHERQILATLDHPNIARLLDGGTTDDGIPYLVMELIDGERVDAYCDLHNLSITARLHLFRQICSAVQYAHRHLVIHRDLKPGNVLVTAAGIPKLLDFGIAKLVDPATNAETTLAPSMTPEYASPEQFRGDPITTASDVYSLGVVLYQLLTGSSPYAGNARSSHELVRAVCELDPGKPSTVVMKERTAPAEAAVQRATRTHISSSREDSQAKLRRRLSGDLDNIVLMALRKEPQRRYASVEQFDEDIRRHLQGLPIAAVKGSLKYRAGKFVRRNRVVMVASLTVAIILSAGVTMTVRQARIARGQAEIAKIERARAEKRFADVRELANSLIFEIHDSIQALPGATPSRKLLLDRAVQYLDKLSQDAAGDLDLQRELGWAYHRLATVQGDTTQSNLGQVAAAEVSNKKAMALFEAVAKANPQNLTDQINLAMAYRWRAFFDVYETTGPAEIDRALAVTEPLVATSADNVDLKNERSQEYMILAAIQDARGDRLQAIDSYRKVHDLRQEILRTNPDYPGLREGIAKTTVLLAHEIGRFGSKDEGLHLMNMGIAQFEALVKSSGGDPGMIRELSAAEGRRGDVELMRGEIESARADFRRSRQRIEKLAKLDPENKMLQSDIWVSQFEDGRAIVLGGHNAQALPVLKEAVRGYQSLHLEADVGPGPAAMQAWIAEAQVGTNNLAQALKHFLAAAANAAEDQANFDDARCDLAMIETKIGGVLLKMGKAGDAQTHQQKAIAIANVSVSLKHNDFPALYAAAEAYAGEGDTSLAEARFSENNAARSKLWNEACASYRSSLEIWKHISEPSRFSGNGYLSSGPHSVEQRLSACKAQQPRGASFKLDRPPHISSTAALRQ
jgi:serine/threonine protein kinase